MTYKTVLKSLLILLLCYSPAGAQNLFSDSAKKITETSDSLKVGVVLSGGGARGIAHIGVLKALEDAGVRIDFITGTSMGSLIGGLYAIGYTADQLSELARTSNFIELFTENPNRRYISNYEKGFDERTILSVPISERGLSLPSGLITGQNVYSYLSRLAWVAHGTEDFMDFPIPYAAVGTNIETGEAVVFTSGYLPDAIRASISIPSAFIPHEIDGEYYIDGGLARNLPVQEAIDMGANFTIAVDVTTPLEPIDSLRTLTDIMNQSVQYRINERVQEQRKLADLVIEITEADQFSVIDFDKVEALIKIGEKYGKQYLEKFQEVANLQSGPHQPRTNLSPPTPLPIQNLIIEGNSLFDDDFIARKLEFEPGARLSPELIDEKISKLYSSRYIEQVTYRIKPDSSYYYNLHINIRENRRNDFRVGLRYETQTMASILFEASFQDVFHAGSINRLEARLGDQMLIGGDYIYYGALGSRFAALTSIQYHRENIDWYVDQNRVSQFRNHTLRGEISAGNYFSTNHLFAFGIRKDFIFRRNEINPDQITAEQTDYHAFFFKYHYDYFNRKSYPNSGQKIVANLYHSHNTFFSPIDFSSGRFFWEGYYQVTNSFSIRNSLYAGYTYGNEIPWDYWNTTNRYIQDIGYLHFGGIERYEVSNPHIQAASIGFQFEPFYHRFLNIDFQAGRFPEEFNFDLTNGDIEFGASVSLGALTIVGPIKAILSTGTVNSFKAELQIGYQF
ncbi:patatin-like phospholipase family protein [Rhodohalobacter halophilus]|uniref:patatin-like phospholipase family protein n=1 Tax=Rhodohalobacter halophilus TaxID=1812810 RepID=UPI00083F7D27|nr:patatin-like phospholipase family protein [Rhodohalobacter halophilus]